MTFVTGQLGTPNSSFNNLELGAPDSTATEKFVNLATTTLNGDIDSSATTFSVVSASSFPSTGNFRIIVDTEIMLVTDVNTNNFTVTRAVESTTAIAHGNGAVVMQVVTSGAIAQTRTENVRIGTYANLPAAEKAGRMYMPTDSPYTLYDNGSSWVATVNGILCTIPDFSGFTWVNQGSATIENSHGYSYLSDLTTTTNNQLRILKKAAINTTSYTVTAGIIPLIPPFPGNNLASSVGLVQCSSGGGQQIPSGVFFKTLNGGAPDDDTNIFFGYQVAHFTNTSTGSTWPYFKWPPIPGGKVWWMQLQDDGTSRYYRISFDGINFATLFKEARTSLFTPDQYGIFVDAAGSGSLIGSSIVSFKETTP